MLKTILKIGCVLAVLAPPVAAQEYSAQKGLKSIEFLHGWRTASGTHMAAVRIKLEYGWKTYWRSPGGNGIPPTFKWGNSKNVRSVQYHWPAPKIFMQDGIQTIGYKNELVLPIEFKPSENGQPIKINTQIDFGICSDVCIPVTSRLKADLMANQSDFQTVIKAALSKRPLSMNAGGVQSVSCQIDPIDDGTSILANIAFKSAAPRVQKAVFELPNPNIWVSQTKVVKSGNPMHVSAVLVSFSNEPFILDRSKLRLTLIGKSQAIEINGCSAPS